jgi:hypothetical protein
MMSGKTLIVRTTAVLEIVSIKKGVKYEVGQEVVLEWEDLAFSMCPQQENSSLNGEPREWYLHGEQLKILPKEVFCREGNTYIKVNKPEVK